MVSSLFRHCSHVLLTRSLPRASRLSFPTVNVRTELWTLIIGDVETCSVCPRVNSCCQYNNGRCNVQCERSSMLFDTPTSHNSHGLWLLIRTEELAWTCVSTCWTKHVYNVVELIGDYLTRLTAFFTARRNTAVLSVHPSVCLSHLWTTFSRCIR